MRRPPFLPFRAGPPRFQVALAPIDARAWLHPDSEAHTIPARLALLDAPETCYRRDPAHAAGESEAARLVLSAATGRAPDAASLIDAARAVSDDLVVLHRDGHGEWRVTSLVMTSPTFFSAGHAFARGLEALHGPVPDGNRLAGRIARVFDNLRHELVLERFNWTLQAGPDRFTPDSAPLRQRARAADPGEAESLLHLRVERQTIRALPETGGVLFTIRVAIDPVAAIAAGDRPALAEAWRAISPAGFDYKGWEATDPLAQALFETWGV